MIIVTWWKAAAMEENGPSLLWSALGAGLYAITWLVLGWGWIWLVLAQLSLLVLIGVVRALLHMRKEN